MIAVDTNILIYAFSSQDSGKAKAAKGALEDIFSGKWHGVVTTQILAEFSVVAGEKLPNPLPTEKIRSIIRSIVHSDNWTVFEYDGETVMRATGQKHFWDALITETLLQNGVNEILTENTKHFPKLKAKNPI